VSEAYIGEIRIFGGNFAPKDWALCDGQIINIASNSALYAILVTDMGEMEKQRLHYPI